MAATTWYGKVADTLIATAEANKTTLVAEITADENGLTTFITSAVNAFNPPMNVFESQLFNLFKPMLISALVAEEQANPGSVIFGILDTYAKQFAASIGG